MAVSEVVVGATRKDLVLTLIDDYGAVIDISGGAVKLQGTSLDLPGVTIDDNGSITDGPSGIATWAQLGTFVTTGEMGGKNRATFTLRVKFTDAASKFDWTSAFQIDWVLPPV